MRFLYHFTLHLSRFQFFGSFALYGFLIEYPPLLSPLFVHWTVLFRVPNRRCTVTSYNLPLQQSRL